MNSDTDMWLAFARTFGMLFVVLGLFFLAFYLFRKFSGGAAAKGADLIQILAVHHISPKERLMLVKVINEHLLIGVTPQAITSLAVLGDKGEALLSGEGGQKNILAPGFSDLLKQTLKRSSGPVSSPDSQQGGQRSEEPEERE